MYLCELKISGALRTLVHFFYVLTPDFVVFLFLETTVKLVKRQIREDEILFERELRLWKFQCISCVCVVLEFRGSREAKHIVLHTKT